jgi:hypothetical protein
MTNVHCNKLSIQDPLEYYFPAYFSVSPLNHFIKLYYYLFSTFIATCAAYFQLILGVTRMIIVNNEPPHYTALP